MTATIKDGAGADLVVLTPAEVLADLKTSLGTPTEGPATSDTDVTKGLTGLFKWFLQKFTLFTGQLPPSLGAKTGTSSLSVIHSTTDPITVAVGLAADANVTADDDADGTFFGWFRWISQGLTSIKALVTTGVGYLLTMSSDTSTLPVMAVGGTYKSFPASTTTLMSATGAIGDRLDCIQVFPTTLSPGSLAIKDGSTIIATFPGGASSLSNLVPFTIYCNYVARNSGGWSLVAGAGLAGTGNGRFS